VGASHSPRLRQETGSSTGNDLIREGKMSITLGVFDIFAYAVPGSLYLTVLAYISARFGWLDPTKLLGSNTTLVLIAAALACYLIGHISYPLGRTVGHSVRVWWSDIETARAEFLLRVPEAKGRPFVEANRAVLLAAIEVRQQDASLEIARLRAVGIMMRNCAPAFALGSIVAAVEIVASNVHGFAACCSAILLLAAVGSEWNAARLSHWADMKTLEIAFWIPGIDENLVPRKSS
jgi:hypothetical protein